MTVFYYELIRLHAEEFESTRGIRKRKRVWKSIVLLDVDVHISQPMAPSRRFVAKDNIIRFDKLACIMACACL